MIKENPISNSPSSSNYQQIMTDDGEDQLHRSLKTVDDKEMRHSPTTSITSKVHQLIFKNTDFLLWLIIGFLRSATDLIPFTFVPCKCVIHIYIYSILRKS